MATRVGTLYTGTITGTNGALITVLDAVLVTGEGWTKLYSGTNKAVYQQAAGSGFVLRVLDDGSLAAAAREAVVRPAESATDVDTLVDPFPTTALTADSVCVWRKSDTADSTARNYRVVADDRFFLLEIQHGETSWDLVMFGDIAPFWSGDNYACVFNNREAGNSGAAALSMNISSLSPLGSASDKKFYFARTFSGLVKMDVGGLNAVAGNNFGNTGASSVNSYPADGSTQLMMRRAAISSCGGPSATATAAAGPRGHIPYLFEPMHGSTWTGATPGDTFTHTAYDSASVFRIRQCDSATTFSTGTERWIIQEAGTWTGGSL